MPPKCYAMEADDFHSEFPLMGTVGYVVRFAFLLLLIGLPVDSFAATQQDRESQFRRLVRDFELKHGYPNRPEPQDVLNIGMVGQSAAIPFLRKLVASKRARHSDERLRQAALLALLNLGDKKSYDSVDADLNSRRYDRQSRAIMLLSALDDKAAVSRLVRFLQQTQFDGSIVRSFGDSGWDPRVESMRMLSCMAPVSEDKPKRSDEISIDAWLQWWQRVGDNLPDKFYPPRPSLQGDRIGDLLDAIEWRLDSGAVLRLADEAGASVLSYLRALADFPECIAPPSYYFGNIGGNAQAASAKLGDEESFSRIVKELASEGTSLQRDAVEKLRYVGGYRSVTVLINFLDENKFPSSTGSSSTDPTVAALMALPRMLDEPPVHAGSPPKRGDIQMWHDWLRRQR